MKKTILYLLIALPALLLQSCLKDQEDIFDQPSSLRLQEAVENAHKALYDQHKLWVLDYYPENEQSYGGFSMILQFDEQTVTAWRLKETEEVVASSSNADLWLKATSEYKVKGEGGPLLSFDTYNDVIHYFSTPRGNSAWYQAMQGDFEFIIDSIGADRIKIHGKKTVNTMYLRELKDQDPVDYLLKADAMVGEFIYPTALTTHEGAELPIKFDLDNKQLVLYPNDLDKRTNLAFCFTADGLRLYKPLEINGALADDFLYDGDNLTLTSKTQANSVITLQVPVGYKRYKEWAGNYNFTFHSYPGGNELVSMPVTLEPAGDGMTYYMKGLNENYDLVLNYSRSSGCLELLTQRVGTLANNNFVLLTAWDSKNGKVNYTTTYGMRTEWSESKNTYVWVDNGKWSSYQIVSFVLYEMSAATTRVGACQDEDFFINGYDRIYKLNTLDKVE